MGPRPSGGVPCPCRSSDALRLAPAPVRLASQVLRPTRDASPLRGRFARPSRPAPSASIGDGPWSVCTAAGAAAGASTAVPRSAAIGGASSGSRSGSATSEPAPAAPAVAGDVTTADTAAPTFHPARCCASRSPCPSSFFGACCALPFSRAPAACSRRRPLQPHEPSCLGCRSGCASPRCWWAPAHGTGAPGRPAAPGATARAPRLPRLPAWPAGVSVQPLPVAAPAKAAASRSLRGRPCPPRRVAPRPLHRPPPRLQ